MRGRWVGGFPAPIAAGIIIAILSGTVLAAGVGAASPAVHDAGATTTTDDTAVEISTCQEIIGSGANERTTDHALAGEDVPTADATSQFDTECTTHDSSSDTRTGQGHVTSESLATETDILGDGTGAAHDWSDDSVTDVDSIDSEDVTITLGDDTPGVQTTHDWTMQVSEEIEEVAVIELRYSNAESEFDGEISADDLVGGAINVVGEGHLEIDDMGDFSGREPGTDDLWILINDSSYLAAGDTIEIAWSNDVFTNPSETPGESIYMEIRENLFDDHDIESGIGWATIPGYMEMTDLELTNTDSNQLSEYQFEFSVEEYPIDNVWRIRVDFSDAYEDGLDFDDMDMDSFTDDYWFEDADGNELDGIFQGTVYGTEDVLEFHIEPDQLETDLGAGPYTFGLKNIRNPDPGTDYDVEVRIDDRTHPEPMAADNTTFDTVESPTMSIEDTNLTHSTTYDPGTYEIDVEFATADADDVDGFAVEFIDAGDINATDLTAADVDVTGAVVDEVNTTDTDEVMVELAEPVTYQENEQATIVLDGVTNPSEIGDFDVEVEFFAYGNSYGNDTLADAFSIEPSLVVGDWESPRSVPNGSLSPNSFTVENVGKADLTGVLVYLGADSDADAFEKPATFSAAPEYWSDEAIDAGETKVYEYDLMTADYFDIGENYEFGEDFYHGPAAGFTDGFLFEMEDAEPLPFYISESDDSGSIAISVENETGHPVDGAQVDLYVHEVAPDNLVATEESADSTVTFDESHPDIDEGLAVGTEEAEAVEYVVVVDKDGYEESTQSTALYEGNHEVSEVVTVSEIEPATFEITRFDILETEVETGEEFYTLANITNIGEEWGYDVARLKLDGQELENDTVYLDPGQRDTVSFAHDAPDEEGNYTISIETQDDIATGTLNVTEPEPATFNITRFDILETDVETGEEFYVTTNVTNTGEEFGLDVARLKLDGEELENETFALDPGERDFHTFANDAPDEEGNYTITVETQDDIVTGTLNVTEPEPATFEITRFDILETALEPGEEFYVTTNVTNTGEEFGLDVVRLKLDGEELENESVALDPGERDTVTFGQDAPDEPGQYTVSIETQDDHETEDIAVGPHFQILDADMPVDVDQGDNVTVEFIIENTGIQGTQPVNFTVYAPDEDDEEDPIDASVAVVDDSRNTTQGEAYVDLLENEFETVDLLTNETVLDEMAGYDAFVVYRFVTDTLTGDFHDELDDEQGVVYLDDAPRPTTERWADGIFRLHRVFDDPGHWEHVAFDADDGPPELNITTDHQLFDGIGQPGETVVLNDNTESLTWGSWFEDYSGDVLAEVDYAASDPEQWGGPGVGVDDAENEVLLSALIHDNLLEQITPAGETLIANAVAHVAPDVVVGDVGVETDTGRSESIEGTDDDFPFFGEVVIRVWDELTLDAGETTTLELEYEVPENLAPDRYTQELSTENDAGVSELWVELTADIEVASYSLDPDPATEDIVVGETLTAEATVVNHGDRAGEHDIEYIVDEDVVANQTVEVEDGSTKTIALDHELRETGTKIVSVNGVDPVQIEVDGPEADIEVTSYSLDPDPAEEDLVVGETLTAEPVVTNHGTAPGEFEVEFIVDEEVVANQTVEVDDGSTKTIALDHELRKTGTKIVSVNGVDPAQIEVEPSTEPPAFELTDIRPGDITVGPEAPVTVAVDVTNSGDTTGSTTVDVLLDGGSVASDTVSLDGGATTSIDLAFDSPNETDTYTVTIQTANESVSQTLTVAVPEPITEGAAVPQDTTGDGLYDDVTGSGESTIFDVQVLFSNLDSDTVQDNAWAFDFGGHDRETVDIFDVQGLFGMV